MAFPVRVWADFFAVGPCLIQVLQDLFWMQRLFISRKEVQQCGKIRVLQLREPSGKLSERQKILHWLFFRFFIAQEYFRTSFHGDPLRSNR